jgi:hypothetical protein
MKALPVPVSLMQSQLINSLESSSSGAKSAESWANIFSQLISNSDPVEQLTADPLTSVSLFSLTSSSRIYQNDSIKGLSTDGRNMALADPESAYKMMSVINNDDVTHRAQFSELSQVKSCVAQMQDAGQSLDSIALFASNDSIKSSLHDFVTQYNTWIQRINPDIRQGGLLADTQAAQVSQYELGQNFKNRFFGGKDGVHGLRELGITIDPDTQLAFLDSAKLDKLLVSNKQGVVDTVQEFSKNFAKSASLLNSDGNFIPRQLYNLKHAIHFIADNKASLQAEFGTGNAAKPTGQVAAGCV